MIVCDGVGGMYRWKTMGKNEKEKPRAKKSRQNSKNAVKHKLIAWMLLCRK